MNKNTYLLALALLGCDPDASETQPEEPGFACAIDALTGTWRVTYSEQDGDCGPVASETVSLGGTGGDAGGCKTTKAAVSADRCSREFDFTCPTTDGEGSQRWTGITRQVSARRLESDATAQLQHPELGVCRSTYTMVWTRL
jgi:hypothetical protein